MNELTEKQIAERDGYVSHIMRFREVDPDEARSALVRYHNAMPWLEIMAAVKAEIAKEPRK
jgi:hypothetical protein